MSTIRKMAMGVGIAAILLVIVILMIAAGKNAFSTLNGEEVAEIKTEVESAEDSDRELRAPYAPTLAISNGLGIAGCTKSWWLNGATTPCLAGGGRKVYAPPEGRLQVLVPGNGGLSNVIAMKPPSSNGVTWVSCIWPPSRNKETGQVYYEVIHQGESFGERWTWEPGNLSPQQATTIQFKNHTPQSDYVELWFVKKGADCE